MTQAFIALSVSFLVTLLTTPLMIFIGKKCGLVDKPDARKIHKEPIPRVGGVAIFLGFFIGCLVLGRFGEQMLALMAASVIIMLLGFVDDARNIPPIAKLIGQAVAAFLVVRSGLVVEFLTNPFTGGEMSLGWLSVPLTMVWLIGMSNAVNLIDGMDGEAAGVSAISAGMIAIICVLQGPQSVAAVAGLLAAACIAFLVFNFNPAKIFMGDSGSLFIGFALATISIMGFSKSATFISVVIPIIILGTPIMDTFFAILRRLFSHKPVFEADKGHMHHRLLQRGLSQKKAVLIIYAVTFLLGIAAILMSLLTTAQALVILIIVILLASFGADKLGVLKPSGQKVQSEKE